MTKQIGQKTRWEVRQRVTYHESEWLGSEEKWKNVKKRARCRRQIKSTTIDEKAREKRSRGDGGSSAQDERAPRGKRKGGKYEGDGEEH